MQESESGFVTSRQKLAPAIFKMVENRSFDAEQVAGDESVTYDDHSTAEELVMSNVLAGGQDGCRVCSRDVVFEF